MKKNTGICYLLHFSEPLGTTGRNSASHYTGFAVDLDARLDVHRQGKGPEAGGARIMQALHERGGSFQLARTWKDTDRHFERRLKKNGHARRKCPICRGESLSD